MKHLFVVFGGESARRSRTKKVLKYLQARQITYDKSLFWEDHKILVSGRASFNPTVSENNSEAFLMRSFLISRGVPPDSILTETQSLDTLGNLVFSYEIIIKLLLEHKSLQVYFVTEGFHMNRVRVIVTKVFSDVIESGAIKVHFISSPTSNIPFFLYKTRFAAEFKKILSGNVSKKYWSALKQRSSQISKRYILDQMTLEVIFIDMIHFHLSDYKTFRNYVFSLPIYNSLYKPDKIYNIRKSLYAKAILHLNGSDGI